MNRNALGDVIGYAGAAVVGVGVYLFVDYVDDPEATATVVNLGVAPIGIALVLLGCIIGEGRPFIAMYGTAGAGTLAAGTLHHASGSQVTGTVLIGLCGLLVWMPWSLHQDKVRAAARHADLVGRLLAHGVPATAIVLSLHDTGATTNDDPEVRLVLRLDAVDRDATIRVDHTRTVSRLEIPRVGHRFAAWFVPDDPEAFLILDETAADVPEPMVRWRTEVQGREPVAHLAQLWDLHQAGALTRDEFERQKARLLQTR